MKKLVSLGLLLLTCAANGANPHWNRYEEQTIKQLVHIPGWCSEEKAKKMMDLIYETHPKICVEIGVFGGSSIYPTASALKYLGAGVVHAIDPWAKDDCLEGYTPDDPNYQWWGKLDLDQVYNNFKLMLNYYSISPFCQVMRMTSKAALSHFENESIDILHIDGNHTEQVALADAEMYLPKVKMGGYIWFDDVNWVTTNKAVAYLMRSCTIDFSRSTATCYLFKKHSNVQ